MILIFVTDFNRVSFSGEHSFTDSDYLNSARVWINKYICIKQNDRHFTDDTFRCIFLNENFCISIKISLKFVSKSLIDNIPALVHIMAWGRIGDKPLSEPMLTQFADAYMRL